MVSLSCIVAKHTRYIDGKKNNMLVKTTARKDSVLSSIVSYRRLI